MLRLGVGYADPVRSANSSTRAERARRAKETIADYCASRSSPNGNHPPTSLIGQVTSYSEAVAKTGGCTSNSTNAAYRELEWWGMR